MSGESRREFSRVAVHLKAELTAEGGASHEGSIENLSLKGCFFRTGARLAEGVSVDVRLQLDGSDIQVHTRGFVVRAGAGGYAVQFTEIVGLESLEHLRNLVLFNTHDPRQVEEEFQRHLGLMKAE
jgi:hypothetical protein